MCPVGIDHKAVVDTLSLTLEQFHYRTNSVRLSELFPQVYAQLGHPWAPPASQSDQANYKIEAGKTLCYDPAS